MIVAVSILTFVCGFFAGVLLGYAAANDETPNA